MEHLFYFSLLPFPPMPGPFPLGVLLHCIFRKKLNFTSALINSCSIIANFKKFVLDLLNAPQNPLIYSSIKHPNHPLSFKHELFNGPLFTPTPLIYPHRENPTQNHRLVQQTVSFGWFVSIQGCRVAGPRRLNRLRDCRNGGCCSRSAGRAARRRRRTRCTPAPSRGCRPAAPQYTAAG